MLPRAKYTQFGIVMLPAICIFVYLYQSAVVYPVYDEYQSLVHQMAAGFYSDDAVMDQYFLGYVGYSYILTWLYRHLNTISWMAVLELGSQLLITFYILYVYYELLKQFFNNFWFLTISMTALLLSFMDAYAMISFSRPALFMCGIAIYRILFCEQVGKVKQVSYHILFLLGLLLRPEAAMGMILLMGGGYLIYKLDIRSFLSRMKWVILLMSLFLITVALLIRYSGNFLFEMEPEVEYKFMQGYVKKLEPHTSPVDSIKYEVATNGFIFDPQVLTAQYLRSIQTHAQWSQLFEKTEQATLYILKRIGFYTVYLSFFFLGVLLAFIKRKYRLLLRILLLSSFLFLIFISLKINSGIGERHIQPMLAMYVLMTLFYMKHELNKRELTNPAIWTPALLLLLFFSKGYMDNISGWAFHNRLTAENAKLLREELEHQYQGRLIVFTLSTLKDFFPLKYQLFNHKNFKNRYMIFEFYNYSMVAPYDKYLKKVLHQSSYNANDVYTYLCKHHAIYLASEKKTKLTQDYLRIMYNNPVRFEKEQIKFEKTTDVIASELDCN